VEVHIHDPGRLKELLYPGNKVLLKKAANDKRKTKWDVIAASYHGNWILAHSGYHSDIAEWIIKKPEISPFGKIKDITREPRMGKSRLDFLLEKMNGKKIWVEVKGCTLAINGIALFPDAPTARGKRHLETLISAIKKGAKAAVFILVFRPDAKCFAPNKETDPDFSNTFYEALDMGVMMYPLLFRYEDEKIYYLDRLPLCPHTSTH
jgi:sugar fermentation stimulation protein A